MCLDITLLPNPAAQNITVQNVTVQNVAAQNPHFQFPGTGTTVFPLPGTFPWSAGVRGEEIKIMYFCRQRRKNRQTKTQRQTDRDAKTNRQRRKYKQTTTQRQTDKDAKTNRHIVAFIFSSFCL